LRSDTGRGIIIGEWGGFYSGMDKVIQDYQAAYFNSKGISCQFYWALNPNPGGDTDGILQEDWTTANTDKLNFLNTAFPTSTKFSTSGSQVCFGSSVATTAAGTSGSASSSNTVNSGTSNSGAVATSDSSSGSVPSTSGSSGASSSGTTTDGSDDLGNSQGGNDDATSGSAQVAIVTLTFAAGLCISLW